MRPYTPLQIQFWYNYLIQMRPYLLFVSGAAGLSGLAAGLVKFPETPILHLYLAFSAFFLAYGFGQALTDCFQMDTDRLSAPERPLSKGLISPRHVLVTSVVGLIASAGILIWLNLVNLIFSVLSTAGLATYTFIKRRYWWGGPPYNAWIVTLLPIMGYLSVASDFAGMPWWLMGITFFAYANFVLMGYLKDIDADAATGYHTFPVVFGWRTTVKTGHILAALALAAFLPFWGEGGTVSRLAWLLALVAAAAGQIQAALVKEEHPGNAIFSISCTVRTFILLHWAVILYFQPKWLIFCMLYCLFFELTLFLRHEPEQV